MSGTTPDFAVEPPAFVVVEGEPGAGRTRLLDALGRREGPDVAVLHVRCARRRRPVPLGPVIEALAADVGRWSAAASRLSPLGGSLRPIVPELGEVLPAPLPEPPGRHLVFRALRELLTTLERTVLLVDDAHDADEETQDLLRFLADNPSPGLAVVTTSATLTRQPARGGSWWPPRSGVTARFTLSPLDVDDVAALAGSRELGERVHRRTGGVRGAVHAVLQAPGDIVPAAWSATLVARFAEVDPDCAALVEAAVVLGRPAGDEALAAVSEVDGITDALLTALDGGFLRDLGRGRYAPRSPLVADA
ncbi:AAA family ATPase, partial [Amycolatopsis pittospori]|uniref:AAA family ATPase n=1 Tax=Amycolatopsis pittospori TaxID=2749434 RepID=UPI0015F05BCE